MSSSVQVSSLRRMPRDTGAKKIVFGKVCNEVLAESEYANNRAKLSRESGVPTTPLRTCVMFANFPVEVQVMLQDRLLSTAKGQALLKLCGKEVEPLAAGVAKEIIPMSKEETHDYIDNLLKAVALPHRKTGTKPDTVILSKEQRKAIMETFECKVAIESVRTVAANTKNPILRARAYKAFLDEFPELLHIDLHNAIKVSDNHMSLHLSYLRFPQSVQSLIFDGTISGSVAGGPTLLLETELEDRIAEIAEDVIQAGLSGEAVRVLANCLKSPKSDISKLPVGMQERVCAIHRHWLYDNNKFTKNITIQVAQKDGGGCRVVLECESDADTPYLLSILAGKVVKTTESFKR